MPLPPVTITVHRERQTTTIWDWNRQVGNLANYSGRGSVGSGGGKNTSGSIQGSGGVKVATNSNIFKVRSLLLNVAEVFIGLQTAALAASAGKLVVVGITVATGLGPVGVSVAVLVGVGFAAMSAIEAVDDFYDLAGNLGHGGGATGGRRRRRRSLQRVRANSDGIGNAGGASFPMPSTVST